MSPDPPRIALVTGTSSGIGAAVAARLLARGWEVIGVARRPARFEHASYTHLRLDLADFGKLVGTMNERVAPRLSAMMRLGLVNNAGTIGTPAPLPHLEPEDFTRVYAINTVAPAWLMGFFVRHCTAQAVLRIVNLSSGVARHPSPGLVAYNSSKAALLSAGMTLAGEWDAANAHAPALRDAAILSYEPHVVETEMQATARSLKADDFPWVSKFQEYKDRDQLVPPEGPAGEIAAFLEAERQPSFVERRYRP
jgi:benzil reductase ((S)-benzoin forming)